MFQFNSEYVVDAGDSPEQYISRRADRTAPRSHGHWQPAQAGGLASDTLIETRTGQRPAGELRAGDEVLTLSRGFQPVLWAATWSQGADEDGVLRDRPLQFDKQAFGEDQPTETLVVAPSQHLVLRDPLYELLFGSDHVVCMAGLLRKHPAVSSVASAGTRWTHLLFDRTEVIRANGMWVTSLEPDLAAIERSAPDQAREICAALPQLRYQTAEAVYVSPFLELDAREAAIVASVQAQSAEPSGLVRTARAPRGPVLGRIQVGGRIRAGQGNQPQRLLFLRQQRAGTLIPSQFQQGREQPTGQHDRVGPACPCWTRHATRGPRRTAKSAGPCRRW